MVRKLSALLMVVALAGCGDDTQQSGPDGAGGMSGSGGSAGTGGAGGMMIDAPAGTDGMTDGSTGAATCGAYCDCMLSASHCLGSTNGFTQRGACMSACANYTATQLQCRTDHCGFATDPSSVHCQHAVGMGAGLPAECR